MSNSELACVYAALILADDDVAITVSNIEAFECHSSSSILTKILWLLEAFSTVRLKNSWLDLSQFVVLAN